MGEAEGTVRFGIDGIIKGDEEEFREKEYQVNQVLGLNFNNLFVE